MRSALIAAVFCFAAQAAVQQDIEYRNIEGKILTLDASIPDGPGPFPAVIIVHGGSWARGTKRSYVTPLFEPLTAAGFVWFSIDYRLTPEFQFPAPTDDVIGAIEWVRANADQYKVDTSRLVLAGESAGGQMVAYVGARYGEALGIAAVIDFYGPNDMMAQGAKTKAARAHPDPDDKSPSMLPEYLGIKEWDETATAKMREASPITWVEKDMPPFLCVHGTADAQVPYEQSPKFCAAIKKAGGNCEVQTIEGGGHGMSGWQTEWKPQVIAWLKKNLRQ
ncbi:MAG TPA: alpha/beta hydrolase [Gemmataceae bacterium]|jgi:alpha-L-fucosidase 2|nr:alpha/beta hydrolase [Gemmataceae bacterium]